MSLMCFVEANQLYSITRELKRTKTDLVQTKDELQMMKKCSIYLHLMKEGLSYENAVYVSDKLGMGELDDLSYVGENGIRILEMNSTDISKFRTIARKYKSEGECTFIRYLRENGFCRSGAMSISKNLRIQLVERLNDVTEDDIDKLELNNDDRTLLVMIWKNYMNEIGLKGGTANPDHIDTPRSVYFLLQDLKSL